MTSREYKSLNVEAGEGTPAIPWPKDVSPSLTASFGRLQGIDDQNALSGGGLFVPGEQPEVSPTISARDSKGVHTDPTVSGPPLIQDVVCMSDGQHNATKGDNVGTTLTSTSEQPYIAFSSKDDGGDATEEVSPTLRSMNNDKSNPNAGGQVAISFQSNDSQMDGVKDDGACVTLKVGSGETSGNPPAVAFQQNSRDEVRLVGGDGQNAGALSAEPGMKQQNYVIGIDPEHNPTEGKMNSLKATGEPSKVLQTMGVRRLTPEECERLQGFPTGFTRIPWRNKTPEDCPDGPRYKALGNSMAVNVMAWIGQRIQMVSDLGAQE
jgi:site-specific DNA-cytosine methylase